MEQAEHEQRRLRNAAHRNIQLEGECCAVDGMPEGRELWCTAGVRGRHSVVLGHDGGLWAVVYPSRFATVPVRQDSVETLHGHRLRPTAELLAAFNPRPEEEVVEERRLTLQIELDCVQRRIWHGLGVGAGVCACELGGLSIQPDEAETLARMAGLRLSSLARPRGNFAPELQGAKN